jgi:hypothetical protein
MDQINDRELDILFSLVQNSINSREYIRHPENNAALYDLDRKIRAERSARNL